MKMVIKVWVFPTYNSDLFLSLCVKTQTQLLLKLFPLPKPPSMLQPTSPVMIKNVLTTVRTYNFVSCFNFVNSLQFYIHFIFPISSVVSLDTIACGIREYDPPFCFLMLVFVVCIKMWRYMQFLFCADLRPQSAACKSENKQTSVRLCQS